MDLTLCFLCICMAEQPSQRDPASFDPGYVGVSRMSSRYDVVHRMEMKTKWKLTNDEK